MKYLKQFENFYTPAAKVFKSNDGSDELNDTGAFTYPLNVSTNNDEEIAFNRGEEDFNKGIDFEENPYLEAEFRNANLIKSWNDGWRNGEKNKKLQ